MSAVYYRNPSVFKGGPFYCYNCNKLLITKVTGDNYKLEMKCPRCKAYIVVKMREPTNAVSEPVEGYNKNSSAEAQHT